MTTKTAYAAPDTASPMQVTKRNGTFEPVDVNKIVAAVTRSCTGLSNVDPLRVATKTISGLYDGATTRELDLLSIRTAASLIVEEFGYSKLAARLLSTFIDKEVSNQGIHAFSQSIAVGHAVGLISDKAAAFVADNARKLNNAIEPKRSDLFPYFGIRTVYDRYLLKNPTTRAVIETPQYFFMRVAVGLANTVSEAVAFYGLISSHDYLPSSPTLFNSGTRRAQMSSCYLLDSPADDLSSIYQTYTDIALLSKFAGGIGVGYHRIRARGSLIAGTNGFSNGVVPWLKTLDSSVAAVNQGGKRKGACCVYLESWHADIQEFLDLKENTGDEARRTYNLNTANWVPDLFMKRVEEDGLWSLFDPKVVPHFPDLYGAAFEEAYLTAERQGLYVQQIKARDLYAKMMRNLAQTGNGWMTFKDACNIKCNQTGNPGNVVHLSNLCTEITEVSSDGETAVCNLGSINLAGHVKEGAEPAFDFEKLGATTRMAIQYLDRVIDINYYPTQKAAASNARWRPVGLGVMGLQDAFFKMRLPFDAPEARALSAKIQEEIYYHALDASCSLAEADGPHPSFHETRAAKGWLQFDAWESSYPCTIPSERWELIRRRVKTVGLRNSLMIAIAPTATIASITGVYECIEPALSNLFKRETLSGDFLQINQYLVDDLKALGLWNEAMRTHIKLAEGSIQGIAGIPDHIKDIYRTAWEIPMRSLVDMAADRAPYIDQSQSLNLFVESPTIGKLSSMYLYAWKRGLKTTYYLRSRPATRITKVTVPVGASSVASGVPTDEVACSLENPESCEACQ